ncbi:hypothetical protein ACU4GD_20840 [Cupriavidus basilensis]
MLTGTALFFAPLVWLGVRPEVVLAAVSFSLLYQFWLPRRLDPETGSLV